MYIFLVPLVIFLFDQLSKSWVKLNLIQYEPVNILGHYLRFTYCENPGMAFGIQLGNYIHILTIVSVLFTFYIIYYLYEIMNEKIMIKLPISFILGGALGNVYDRVMMFIDPSNVGGVVDFIDIGISFSMRWYIFNIADTAITCGIILYLIDTFYTKENNSLITS